MKRMPKLSVILYDALVLVLIVLESSMMDAQTVQNYREFNLTAPNGSISSPHAAMSYPKNVLWIWTIPPSQYQVIIKIIEMDLYRCYMFDKNRECIHFDHVIINSYGPYCNSFKPEKIIVLPPWTEIKITFRSFSARDACRGYGFEADYRLVLETTTPIPATVFPSYFTENPKKGDSTENVSLEVTVPIAIGIALVAMFLIIFTAWCCHKKTRNQQSFPGRNQDTRAREIRNNLLGITEEEQQLGRTRPPEARGYLELLRNDLRLEPLNRGPPPTYDEICNDNLIGSQTLESPPSYENVMSECHPQVTLNQSNESTSDLQRNYDSHRCSPPTNVESSV